ncbi:LysM peptidoglycan-binding domain-containing protein [Psychrobacillus sp. FSL W7-1457]|uniref:LysM peptidoglycan-binding domain-containing protein n=1 Tax=unclassified Psychrobacillus TaxID=2636677 RepID=UPI0030F7F82D
MIIYVVNNGDTLWEIANRYQIDVNAILQANQLPDPNTLLVGQSLIIPIYGIYHTVQTGETLWSIAQQYGITEQSILLSNRLANPNLLYPGERIFIPPIIHVVQPGETLRQIASLYGTTIQALINQNRIQTPGLLYPGTQLIIPRVKPLIEVNAYTYQKEEDAVKTVNSLQSLLTYISPFAYKLTESGDLEPLQDELLIEAAITDNIVPMMVVTNFSSTEAGTNLMHVIFSNPDILKKLMTNILQIMEDKGYRGLNIDLENVLPEDRDAYTSFLQLAVDTLHPKGYFVSTAVAPKVSETQSGLLYEAHDYEAHGKIADFVILMTYEWGWRGASPQAISPVNQMKKVVEYALTVIPADKLFLGFQIYARDWRIPHQAGQIAETFSPQDAITLATQYGARIQFDTVAQSPFFNYTDEQGQKHEVWFEDARSAQAKFNLVKQYRLRGISYWVLGYSFPQNWVLLDDNFEVKKIKD